MPDSNSPIIVVTTPKPEPSLADAKVRDDIRHALSVLLDDLADYDQTTHGAIGGSDIQSVCRALCECYDDPRPYTISTLSQIIARFIC